MHCARRKLSPVYAFMRQKSEKSVTAKIAFLLTVVS